ncbi:hypothetical protein BBP40_006587 [Aspergillus hancockii]|nr:hypothetical protein BBP40_006587 [Aspergillus hancockii]
MSSTTLMTFLLHTNPQVKSVKLLGSWDNFSKPYLMENDRRIGLGHWRGCHIFTNIICDGSPNNMVSPRCGGLKMGGTYWYYYLLDNDVESYNHAEPVTSHCPFLPGQPVNVLHVPVILPDTRPIHSSDRNPGCQKAEQRTMNPDDKYMNPRQPPKPALPRLRTSPPFLQAPTPAWSFSTSPLGLLTNRDTSQPNSATPKATIQSGQRAPGSKAARSVSPPRSRGIRAAFRQWNASSPDLNTAESLDNDITKSIFAHEPGLSRTEGLNSPQNLSSNNQTGYTEHNSVDGLLSRRRASYEHYGSGMQSIQDRRALNPRRMEHTAPSGLLTLQTNHERVPTRESGKPRTFSHTPQGSTSSAGSVSLLKTALPVASKDAATPTPLTSKEKRLPTLPNTPSSVMDEALRDLEARDKELEAENLGSHFSDFSTTEGSRGSSLCERSHFSEWSTDTELISPESMTSSLTFNNEPKDISPFGGTDPTDSLETSVLPETSDPNTPQLTVNSRPSPTTLSDDSPRLDLPLPRLTVSLSPSEIDFSGLCLGNVDVESNPKRHAAFFGGVECLEGLGLLRSPEPSAIQFAENVRDGEGLVHNEESGGLNNGRSRSSLLGRSAAMQDMMDELSYLKSMIHSGSDGGL